MNYNESYDYTYTVVKIIITNYNKQIQVNEYHEIHMIQYMSYNTIHILFT